MSKDQQKGGFPKGGQSPLPDHILNANQFSGDVPLDNTPGYRDSHF